MIRYVLPRLSHRVSCRWVLSSALVILLVAGLTESGRAELPLYRFSLGYATSELMTNDTRAEEFSIEFAKSVGCTFHQAGVGYDAKTGMTFDGHPIDFESGGKLGAVRLTTAPSKEAAHICLLSLALMQSPRSNAIARAFVSPGNPDLAPAVAKALLERKLLIFEDFAARYPGYGNWLPWVETRTHFSAGQWSYGLEAARDSANTSGTWSNRLPALDNGQFAWALLQAEGIARDAGEPLLADRITRYLSRLKQHARRIFFDESRNRVRGVTRMQNALLSPGDQSYEIEPDTPDYYLGDGYEGELMELFLTIYGALSGQQVDALWSAKDTNSAIRRTALAFTNGTDVFTIERGFRFSPHEQWARLQFPYLDDNRLRRIFVNGEKVRTHFSATHMIPGLLAAAHQPNTRNDWWSYEAAYGIPGAGSQTDTITSAVSPYASFTTILADRRAGAAWLDLMLDTPRAQGPHGLSDALDVNGNGFAPIVTCDGNLLPVLAFAIEEEYRQAGQHPIRKIIGESSYQMMASKLWTLYSHAFPMLDQPAPALSGEQLPFAGPTQIISAIYADFPNPSAAPSGNALTGSRFEVGSGALTVTNDPGVSLGVSAGNGFAFTMFDQIQATQASFLHLDAQASSGCDFWIELKDGRDRARRRFQVHLPAASAFTEWNLPLAEPRTDTNFAFGLLVIADTTEEVSFRSLRLTSTAHRGALMFSDGVGYFSQPVGTNIPTDVLSGAVFQGGADNMLFTNHTFTDGILYLPHDSGWVHTFHPEANLRTKPWLVFRAKTQGGGLFLENKNQADELVFPNKLRLDFPSTQGDFRYCSLDLSAAPTAATDLVVKLLALSDPEDSFYISELFFTNGPPSDGFLLEWDGRRYAYQPQPHFVDVPFRDLLWEMNLSNRGMDLSFNNVLTIGNGGGFAYGFSSPFELLNAEQNPFLNLVIRTSSQPVLWTELKGTAGGFVGGLRYGNYKLGLQFPDTKGEFHVVSVPLTNWFVSSVSDRFVRQVVFSDASGQIDIAAFGLSASLVAEIPHASVKVQTSGTVLFTGYGGSAEVSTNLKDWRVLQDYAPPYQPQGQNPCFFRIRAARQ